MHCHFHCVTEFSIKLKGDLYYSLMVSAEVVQTFVYLICSTIAKDVGACSAAAAPSRGWFYVDRVTHLLEFVILAKSLRKQHATSWDMDTKIELREVYFLCLILLVSRVSVKKCDLVDTLLLLWKWNILNSIFMEIVISQ